MMHAFLRGAASEPVGLSRGCGAGTRGTLAESLKSLLFVQHRLSLALAQISLFSYCQVQILEMPSKTSVCSLKPEAGARPGMPMCLQLWQVRPSTASHAHQPHPLAMTHAHKRPGSMALKGSGPWEACAWSSAAPALHRCL